MSNSKFLGKNILFLNKICNSGIRINNAIFERSYRFYFKFISLLLLVIEEKIVFVNMFYI